MVELLQPAADDLSILKPRHSAFYGTPLEFLLDELKVRRLILTGIAADICVLFTAHDAYLRKFELWVPSDCVAAESNIACRDAMLHMRTVLKATTATSSAWPGDFQRTAVAAGKPRKRRARK